MPRIEDKGDLISRRLLLSELMSDPIGKTIAERYNLDGWIEGFPPAWVDGKKTDWKQDHKGYRCLKCGFKTVSKEGWHYCPSCGAEIRGIFV